METFRVVLIILLSKQKQSFSTQKKNPFAKICKLKNSLCTQNTSPARTLISPRSQPTRFMKVYHENIKTAIFFPSPVCVFFPLLNTLTRTQKMVRKTYGGEAAALGCDVIR